MTSPTIHYPGAFYHVMLRGNRKQPIFREGNDYRAFEARLATSLLRGEARCHAFCWMNNHVHLLIQVSASPLHKVIHRVATTYAGWFNRKYDLVGHLFQGRYKASVVEDDRYLLQAVRYIHLNPVEAGIADHPGEYLWTSYRAYLGGPPCRFLATRFVLSLFGDDPDGARVCFRDAHDVDDGYAPDWERIPDEPPTVIVCSAISELSLDAIVADAGSQFGVAESQLIGRYGDAKVREARTWIVQRAVRSGCASQADVARRLGRSPQAISQLFNRTYDQFEEPAHVDKVDKLMNGR